MELVVYWVVLAVYWAVVFCPGVVLARRLFPDWSAATQLALGPIFALPFVTILWRVLSPLGDGFWTGLVLLVALVAPWAAFRKKEFRQGLSGIIAVTTVAHMVLAAMFLVFWTAPSYGGGDSFFHSFMIPYSFTGGADVADTRPTLLSFNCLALLRGLGGELSQQWMMQLGFLTFSSLAVGPVVLIARKLGGARAVAGAVILCVINPFFIQQTMHAWPKLATTACVLATVYLVFFRTDVRSALAAGFIAAASICCHPSGGILLLGLGAVWVLSRNVPNRWKRLAALTATGAAGLGAFLAWASTFGFEADQSKHLMGLFAIGDWQETWAMSNEDLMANFHDATIWDYLNHRLGNWLSTFSTFRMREAFVEYDTVPGAVGMAVCAASLFAAATLWTSKTIVRGRSVIIMMVLWSFMVAFWAGFCNSGLAGWGLWAFVLLMLALAGVFTATRTDRRPWFAVFVLEAAYLGGWWVHRAEYVRESSRRLVDPMVDDFLERDLWNIAEYTPQDIIYAYRFVHDDLQAAAVIGSLVMLGVGTWFLWTRIRRYEAENSAEATALAE